MHFKPLAIYAAALILLAALLATAGCGSSGPPRAAIHGRVTAGGQPLTAGRILFTPVRPNKGPATTARISNGEYQLSTKDGPVVGANRVQIEADLNLGFELDDEAAYAQRGGAPLPPQPIPPEFNQLSTISVEVKADEDNAYDVTIPQLLHVAARP
jgi:hypothetical protein